MKSFVIFLFYATLHISGIEANLLSPNIGANLTDFVGYRRKRSLIFTNSGTIKLSVGPSMPVTLADPITWRSLVCSYTLQGGHYALPTEPLYPWDKWEDTFARALQKTHTTGNTNSFSPDDSRLFVYTLLETFLHRQNGNGRACLLRAICQNAQVDQHVGIFSEILDVLLTPGKESLDVAYKDAHLAGATGVDCLKLYEQCPAGTNLLDQYLDYL